MARTPNYKSRAQDAYNKYIAYQDKAKHYKEKSKEYFKEYKFNEKLAKSKK